MTWSCRSCSDGELGHVLAYGRHVAICRSCQATFDLVVGARIELDHVPITEAARALREEPSSRGWDGVDPREYVAGIRGRSSAGSAETVEDT